MVLVTLPLTAVIIIVLDAPLPDVVTISPNDRVVALPPANETLAVFAVIADACPDEITVVSPAKAVELDVPSPGNVVLSLLALISVLR